MKICLSLPILGASLAHGLLQFSSARADPTAAWTNTTSVGVAYAPRSEGAGLNPSSVRDPIRRSPSNDRFFIITRHGDLKCDCNVYDLRVYFVADIAAQRGSQPPPPRSSVTIATNGNFAGIGGARWIDNDQIAFMGARGDEAPQVYTLQVESGKEKRLTHAPLGVRKFDVRGGSVVYLAKVAEERLSPQGQYPVMTVDNRHYGAADSQVIASYATTVSYRGGAEVRLDAPHHLTRSEWNVSISPDGRYAVVLNQVLVADQPQSWRAYGADPADPHTLQSFRIPADPRTMFQYQLYSLDTGRRVDLLDTPAGDAIGSWSPTWEVLWFPDSRRAILTNTTLPVTLSSPEHAYTSYVVEMNVDTHEIQVVASLPTDYLDSTPEEKLTDAIWKTPGKEFQIRANRGPARVYRRHQNSWIAEQSSARASHGELPTGRDGLLAGWRIAVEEGANRPPVVVAERDRKRMQLLDLNPQLSAVRRVTVQTIKWRDGDGRTWTGGLMMPEAAGRSDSAIPLVINFYRFLENRFLPDGSSPTAYAGQSLSTHGIAVLYVNNDDVAELSPGPGEGPAIVKGLDGAVDYLAQTHVIDPDKVGFVGFSHGGSVTSYVITHPGRIRLAAAVCADGGASNYQYYLYVSLVSSDTGSALTEHNLINGGVFWSNKGSWLEASPGFNLDRVRTPLLITMSGYGAPTFGRLNQGIDEFAGLRILQRPVEMLYYPAGEHQLQRPLERLASLQATTDWMRFWLQGKERIEPLAELHETADIMVERNARWRKMREQQNEVLKLPPSPKGKWVLCDTDELTKELCARKPQ